MTTLKFDERVRVYIKTITWYIVGLVFALLAGILTTYLNEETGTRAILISTVLLFGVFHWHIAKELVKGKMLNALPVVITSTALLVYKIYLNETMRSACLETIPDWSRLFNYVGYSIWTGVLLWEACIKFYEYRNNKP